MDYNKLAEKIVLYAQLDKEIEEAKEKIRELTEEEIKTINKNTNLHIARSNKTFTTYSSEYKTEVEKLKAKFPPTKEVKENYNITLTTQDITTLRKVDTINKLANNNITTLRKATASINKTKRK